MSRRLHSIYVERYGGLVDRQIGPFDPGLNVVYGPNEAGKSTLASLIGGVLFGWEDAHGVRNTYRPDDGGDRSGRLEFLDPKMHIESSSPYALRLSRDEAGMTGDDSVLADIDQVTYDTIFSLKAEELSSLRGSSNVASRLLTAGSGTGSSPAEAFVEIEQRIAALTAPTSINGGSIFALQEQLEEKRAQVKAASDRTALLIQEDRELRELKVSRATTLERIDALNDELESLVAWRAEASSIDGRSAQCTAELDGLREELEAFTTATAEETAIDVRLLALDSSTERVLNDRLDELAEKQEKLDRAVDIAKENSATSSAAYEALREIDEEDVAAGRSLRKRMSQAVVSVLLPLLFVGVGVPVFIHGRQINSLSITALGISLVVMAMFLAVAAFFVLFRRPKGEDALEARQQDAQWVMLQDRKKLDACLAERAQLEEEKAQFFENAGLAAAEGSVRQARSLLDEARAVRARKADLDQRISSLQLRIRAAEKELGEHAKARLRIREAAGLEDQHDPDATLVRQLDALIRTQGAQRDALLQAADDMGQRFGELTRELQLARDDHTFDQLKFDYQQIRTRLREAKNELISLLLAKRLLDRSIAEWEHQGQPEVYAQASRLLAMITDGRWTQVSTSPTGSLIAVAADGTTRDPRHLSLGTCQQLYLALRIALLITAHDVGTAIPVLADDILVNFDADRQRGAARALAELAQHRQVIVFTCHEATANLLQAATRIDL